MEIVEACRDLLLQFFRSFQLEMEVRLKRNSPLSLLLMAEVPFPVSFRVLSVHGSFDHWSRWCPFADNWLLLKWECCLFVVVFSWLSWRKRILNAWIFCPILFMCIRFWKCIKFVFFLFETFFPEYCGSPEQCVFDEASCWRRFIWARCAVDGSANVLAKFRGAHFYFAFEQSVAWLQRRIAHDGSASFCNAAKVNVFVVVLLEMLTRNSLIRHIPTHHRACGRMILSMCWNLVHDAKSLDTVSRVLAYVFIRSESKSASSPPLSSELLKLLILSKIEL